MDKIKLAKELLRIAGSILGPGIPDGTGPFSGTPECPNYDEFSSEEGDETYIETAYGDDDLKVVIEPEDDGYEVEVYQLMDGVWTVIEEELFDTYDEAKVRFEEIKQEF